MRTTTKLIPRDLPLEEGRLLRFRFTMEYVLKLDEDVLQGEPAASLSELETWLTGQTEPLDPGDVHKAVHEAGAELTMVEREVSLYDIDPGTDEVRFEHDWERGERLRGRTGEWTTREWLTEVPEPMKSEGAKTQGEWDALGADLNVTFAPGWDRSGSLVAPEPSSDPPSAAEVMEQDG